MAEFWKVRLDPLRDEYAFGQRWPETRRGYWYPTDPPSRSFRYDECMYFVRVSGFTFRFVSLDELDEVLAFFRCKTQPSSRIVMPRDARDRMRTDDFRNVKRCHHDDWQRWYERIPVKLQANARRERIVRALERALDEFRR